MSIEQTVEKCKTRGQGVTGFAVRRSNEFTVRLPADLPLTRGLRVLSAFGGVVLVRRLAPLALITGLVRLLVGLVVIFIARTRVSLRLRGRARIESIRHFCLAPMMSRVALRSRS